MNFLVWKGRWCLYINDDILYFFVLGVCDVCLLDLSFLIYFVDLFVFLKLKCCVFKIFFKFILEFVVLIILVVGCNVFNIFFNFVSFFLLIKLILLIINIL